MAAGHECLPGSPSAGPCRTGSGPAAAGPCLRPKASALMFACQRDSGANVLRLGFREGTVSKIGRNAYHAFTEDRFYIAPTPVGARAYRIGRRDGVPRPGFIFRRTL